MKYIRLIIFCFLINAALYSQKEENIKLISDFEAATQSNLSFQNGIFITISEPKNDKEALRKGFAIMQVDNERAGGWVILESNFITVDAIEYKAILYEYDDTKYIALHYEMENGNYFFRIYDPTTYINNED
jgi:hypothetical protein